MLRRVDMGSTYRWLAVASFSIGAMPLGGCQVSHIRQMYSKEFDCPDEQVKVESISDDRYRVSGCETVVYQCVSGTCIPQYSASSASDKAGNPATPSAQAAVAAGKAGRPWTEKSESGATIVKLGLKFNDGTIIKLSSVPSSNEGAAQLVLLRYNDEDSEFTKCDLGIMLNGQRLTTPATKKTRNDTTTMLVLQLARATVQEFGLARQMALRACDTRWSVTDEQLAQIQGFVRMYDEEIAWSGNEKSGTGGLMAPASGWASWAAAEPMPSAVTSGAEMQGQTLFQVIAPSVFQVEAQATDGTRQGSAVAISRTDVATNCHVLEGARKIILKQKKDKWPTELVHSDPKTDRCVLHAEHVKFTPIRGVRTYGDLKEGEALFTLGSPSGLELTIANGLLSGLRDIMGQKFIQTTAPISPGSSGGGLFDNRGNLVGITTLTVPGEKKLNQSLNFAIAADAYWQQ